MLAITDTEFEQIKKIMYARTGVFLKPSKKQLVVTRLRKRLEQLDLEQFQEYIHLLEKNQGDELEFFINALTTNETYFFRHTKQFNYLYEKILPELKSKPGREIRIWCAACSTGEEPYSVAITCQEFFRHNPGGRYSIYASDVNSDVLSFARTGQYLERSFKETPPNLTTRYFSQTENVAKVRKEFVIKQNLKKNIRFMQHNLLKPFAEKKIDVIFLRNVMIYFDNDSKSKVVNNLISSLSPGGYIMISLSESLNDVSSPLTNIFSGVYKL
ncbi:MAG: protein-glutamate O-methyltransferase CheR [Candidatus Omnitrophica bacterium]|nr:protein-glutamate O-methyltransferase CheR [Candidatus Omnitrophota bacterium]